MAVSGAGCAPWVRELSGAMTSSLLVLGTGLLPVGALANTYVLATDGQEVEAGNTGVGWTEYAYAKAASSQGVGKIKLEAFAYSQPTTGYPVEYRVARAEAVTSYSDGLVFSANGIAPGTTATVTFGVQFNYSGHATYTGGGYGVVNQEGGAVWSMQQTLGGSSFRLGCSWSSYANQQDINACEGFDPLGQPIDQVKAKMSFAANVVLGELVPLTFYATAIAGVTVLASDTDYYADALLNFDMGKSFYWDGIQGVTVDGVAVDYGLTSTSGADYRVSFAPVPEPGTALLWAAGIGLVWARGRRQRAPTLACH